MKKIVMTVLVLFMLSPLLLMAEDVYIVRSGDSLWKIAQRFEIGLSEIINNNQQIDNPDLIYPNDRIKIPNKDDVKQVENLVADLTNERRIENGLPALELDWQLSRVARHKSKDMADYNYFSHESPNYGSPFNMMDQFGISYNQAAENIARGQTSPEMVVNDWMNSPGHRDNILGDFTHIGVGYVEDGNYWTQMFIKR
ncbi:spore coat assembly protein SafA/uncharacterized protein, YkwD family [Pelagirhabdus alkalitolerans]|uniref:Spore coat assembly protein SafA/uncharacterized protein, YkwD family n=1 Tax=Pelagirhabdus alkalitolerans TaxID=1612202 RepID=A0A1G6HF01_9BACI|nr:CAP domain-containing protein [Pelagirhabdus alkalitolerans]SDB92026.1 spore coat assembly protein SafA/uncharacterized protein, YkwD family [Pelagirhabdus alkalitolerans]